MGIENSYQREVETFRKNFSRFQNKNIVLYGIGRYTSTLIPMIPDYHIIGLMDREEDNIGKIMYGIPIISRQEAEQKADLIIINTAETYWKVIYRRICNMDIPIYYLNGMLAKDADRENSFEKNSYWEKSYMQLEGLCGNYEIISFDIFDTLIMRKVYLPQDIFKLAERRIKSELGMEIDFYQKRWEAACGSNDGYQMLDDIYKEMNVEWQLSPDKLEKIKKIEIEEEMLACVPRRDMVALYNQLAEKKEVCLISDMYLPSDRIIKILNNCGMKKIKNLWISGEKKANKKSGKLWELFAKDMVKGRKALHIGDNPKSDVEVPRQYGIDAYYIMNSTKMWESSSLGNFASNIQSLEQSVFAGLIGARSFNSPFALNESKGFVVLKNYEELGYCLWGGILYSFFVWLVQEAKRRKIGRLVFFARDGYFLEKDYHYLENLWKAKDFPSTCYLAISRRLILTFSYDREGGLEDVIRSPYIGSFRDYLQDRFDIILSENEENAGKQVNIPQNTKEVKNWLLPYVGEIKTQIELEKQNYMKYLKKHNISGADGFVDLWFYGHNQYYLSKLLGETLTGFYFAANKGKENECNKDNHFITCFQEEKDVYAEQCNIKKEMLWAEGFLTAPYGMIKAVDENGEFICTDGGMNQLFFHTRECMNDGVCEFMKDYSELFSKARVVLDSKYIDKFFGEYVEENIRLTQEIKETFYFDNEIVHRWESKVFE